MVPLLVGLFDEPVDYHTCDVLASDTAEGTPGGGSIRLKHTRAIWRLDNVDPGVVQAQDLGCPDGALDILLI